MKDTQIVKIFLHLSEDEQAKRFRARIDAPDKSWEFSLADIHERSYWDSYMTRLRRVPERHQLRTRPVVRRTADDKHNARLIVSQILLDTLSDLKMAYPETAD